MPETRLTLGQALAYLKSDQNSASGLRHLGPEDQQYVESLKEMTSTVSSSNMNFKSESDLEGYLISCMLTNSDDKNMEENCLKLFKQLNDSYHLFRKFTDVVRDFYHTSRELDTK
jgi:hypothetical protein